MAITLETEKLAAKKSSKGSKATKVTKKSKKSQGTYVRDGFAISDADKLGKFMAKLKTPMTRSEIRSATKIMYIRQPLLKLIHDGVVKVIKGANGEKPTYKRA